MKRGEWYVQRNVAGIEFRILGPLEVAVGGRLVPLGAGRQRKLLAVLLAQRNQAVPSARLVDELWGARPPDSAGKALQNYVSQLRKLLGHEVLETTPAGYVLHVAPEELDADRFERSVAEAQGAPPAQAAAAIRQALGTWRGPALAEFAYDDFARVETGRLHELRTRAVESKIEAELALGRHADLIPEIEASIARNPHRERLRAQLMLAFYRCGRQADALAAYTDARRTLADDLGLEPGEELKRLQRAILAHDSGLEAPAADRGRPAGRGRWALVYAVLGLALSGGIAVAAVVLTEGGGAAVTVVPNSVALIDSKDHVRADVRVGGRPVAVVSGAGAVWVANDDDQTISRVDPRSAKELARIGIGTEESDLAVGFGSVWVAGGDDGTLTRVDARTDVIRTKLPLGRGTELAPDPVFAVATGNGAVWATRGNSVVRIDPATDAVTMSIRVERPNGVAAAGGALWVTTTAARLLRFDPRTGRRTASVAVPARAVSPVLARSGVAAVVESTPFRIWMLNAATAEPAWTAADGLFPVDLAWSGRFLYAANAGGTVWRIDANGRVLARIRVGGEPTGVAADGNRVWVTVSSPT